MVWGFDESGAADFIRMLYQIKTDVAQLKRARSHDSHRVGLEYARCIETLEPGGEASGVLVTWQDLGGGVGGYLDTVNASYTNITISDPHSWCFSIGTEDYSSIDEIVPVYQSPFTGNWEVVAPFGLIRPAKPDSTIATGGSGTFSIYEDDTWNDTTVNVTAHLSWGDNSEGVTSGKESWVKWTGTKWSWIGGDCE